MKYKKKILNHEIKGLEHEDERKELIMNVISIERTRFKFSKLIVVPIMCLVLLVSIIIPLNKGSNDTKNIFSIVEVSATEYLINTSKASIKFDIYTLVENEIIKYNDKYSHYKDMEKYVLVNDKVKMIPHEFGTIKVIDVNIDNRINLYIEVVDNDNQKALLVLDYEFTDFKNDLINLVNLLEKYPPIETEVEHYGRTISHYEINVNINGDSEENIKIYKWYIEHMNRKAKLWTGDEIDRVVKTIYMTGTIEDIGEIKNYRNDYIFSNTSNHDIDKFDTKMSYYPIIVNGCETIDLGGTSSNNTDSPNYYYKAQKLKGCEQANNIVNGLIIDLSTVQVNSIDDIVVDLKIGDSYLSKENIEITKDDMIFIGDYLYLLPIIIEPSLINDEVTVSIDVQIYLNDDKIVDIRQSNGFGDIKRY